MRPLEFFRALSPPSARMGAQATTALPRVVSAFPLPCTVAAYVTSLKLFPWGGRRCPRPCCLPSCCQRCSQPSRLTEQGQNS